MLLAVCHSRLSASRNTPLRNVTHQGPARGRPVVLRPVRATPCYISNLAASSEKRNVTVRRPSVCLSVRLSVPTFFNLNRACGAYSTGLTSHQGAACDAASVHYGRTIRRSDILDCVGPYWFWCALSYRRQLPGDDRHDRKPVGRRGTEVRSWRFFCNSEKNRDFYFGVCFILNVDLHYFTSVTQPPLRSNWGEGGRQGLKTI